jgi:tetratricopeptide (TPR) repeat protein
MSLVYCTLGLYDLALKFDELYIAIAGRENCTQKSFAYYNIGCTYNRLGEFGIGISYHIQAATIAIEQNENSLLIGLYCNISNSYNSLGFFYKAMEYSHKSIVLAIKMNENKQKSYALASMAYSYSSIGLFNKSMSLYNDAIQLNYQDGDIEMCEALNVQLTYVISMCKNYTIDK